MSHVPLAGGDVLPSEPRSTPSDVSGKENPIEAAQPLSKAFSIRSGINSKCGYRATKPRASSVRSEVYHKSN